MKSEETKNEETLYENNQVNPSNEVNGNGEQEQSKKDGSVWRKAGVGMGLGILLGSTTSFVTTSTLNSEPGKPVEPIEPISPVEQPEWTDGKVEIATSVNDEMSFSQAFGAARAEVGAGGAFEWRGNVYSTYTAEEWNGMSSEERETYNEHFNWSRHEAEVSQTSTSTTTAQQTVTEPPTKPEVSTTGTVEEPVVEVDVPIQETTPEVEILGVVHDDEMNANLGLMTVDEQEFLFIDVDDNGVFDVVVSDVNGDGQITEDEAADVSSYQMSVSDFESNSFGGNSMYASNDGLTDYTNDVGDVYEA